MKSPNKQERGKLQKRNRAMLLDFRNMFNKKGLRPDVIYEKLADKYFLANETVQKIINAEARNTEKEKPPDSSN